MTYRSSRVRDEEALTMLRLKIAGWSWTKLAAEFGRPDSSIQRSLFAIRKADEAESGESIEGEYW